MSKNGEKEDPKRFEMKINSLRDALAEAENDITRGTACKLRDNIIRMRENFANEKKRLTNEIVRLKKKAKEAEEKKWYGNRQFEALEQLKTKLREYSSGDRTLEMIFKDIVGRIAMTVPNLSEELVNASEDLYRSNCENGELRYEIDELKAMLRIKTDDPQNYMRRITEFKDVARHLTSNVSRLKSNLTESCWNDTWDFLKFNESTQKIEEALTELEKKLKHDRRALMTGGDPVCSRYVKRIVGARLILKRLHETLDESVTQMDKCNVDLDNSEKSRYVEKVSMLKKVIQRTNLELGQLKIVPPSNCRLGGTSCLEYLKKVRSLETILKGCKGKIGEFGLNSLEGEPLCETRSKALDEFRELVEELYSRLKDLENMVYSGDGDSKLLGRIEELEELLVKTRAELSVKEEIVTSLEKRLERGRKDLEESRERNDTLAKKIDSFQEDSESRLVEMQKARADLDGLKTQLQDLQNDKESLMAEMENTRKLLAERNDEMTKAVAARETRFRKLKESTEKLRKEKEELAKKLSEVAEKESPRARAERELNQMLSRLNEANDVVTDLKKKLDRKIVETNRFEEEVCRLTSENEMIRHQHSNDVRELREENMSLFSKYETLESKVDYFDREKKALGNEIEELRAERSLLKSRLNELEKRKEDLLELVEKLERTRERLTEEVSDTKIRSSELAGVLDITKNELKEIRTKNSTLGKDLASLTLKNNEMEARLRTVTTERDDLATRTKELNEENVSLRDDLNKARADREYLSVELNKSRIECDKARARIGDLGKMTDELRVKFEETTVRYKMLDEKARSLKGNNEILRKENAALKARSTEFLERVRMAAEENQRDDDSLLNENEKKRGVKKTTGKSQDKVKSKQKLRKEMKMLKLTNESLKLELANLQTENSEIKMELARVKKRSMMDRSIDGVMEIAEFRGMFPRFRGEGSKASSSRVSDETRFECEVRQEMRTNIEMVNGPNTGLNFGAMKTTIDVLRESVQITIADKKKVEYELNKTLEQMKALKLELIILRDEKTSLRSRLNESELELDNLRIEKAALKDELIVLRKTNNDLRTKIADLQGSYDRLKTFNVKLENKLVGTLKTVSKYTVSSKTPNEFENELNGILNDYASIKESLGIVDHFENQKFAQGESTNV